MKIIVSTGALLKHLQSVQGVIGSNNVLPILENFLFEIKGNKLTISTTDLHTSMTTTMDVESSEDGRIAVPSKILIDILKSLPEQPITLNIDEESHQIELNSDNGKYKLAAEDASDFPKIPKLDQSNSFTIPSEKLLKAITSTLFAASNDELRAAMTGVFLDITETSLTFVATDAHKLVEHRINKMVVTEKGSMIIPKKALSILKSNLPANNTSTQVEFNATNLFFSFGSITMICRLIDQKYPDYKVVIPKSNPNKLIINKSDLLSALKRISIFSNKTTYQVRLKFAGSELTLSAEDFDFSNQAVEKMTCDYNGEDLEIGFNARFLIEMLNNLDSDIVNFELSIPSRPGILTPAEPAEDEETLMLIMPVMISANN